MLALDCASTEFFKDGKYDLEGEGKTLDSAAMAKYLEDLVKRFPIVSIEDGMAEDDWAGWKALTDLLGKRCQLVGDDLFVTNTERLAEGIKTANRQLDPGQGQPDRLAHRDARRRRHGAARGLHRGHVAPLGRDGGFDHRRSRGRDQLRADQDRLALRAPTGSPSTTSSSASKASSAPMPATPERAFCAGQAPHEMVVARLCGVGSQDGTPLYLLLRTPAYPFPVPGSHNA